MPDISAALADNHTAVDEMIAAANRSESVWTTPRASGKWSPQQVVEHVALSLEESGNVVAGVPSKFPSLPRLVRPLVRLIFRWILKRQAFPKGKTPKPFDPAAGPATPAEASVRLKGAEATFDQECRTCAKDRSDVESTVFGTIPLEDYVKFQALHVRHHIKQMPSA
jgi:hypothetical protein